ncbi:MAG: hypothetical protein DWQ08_12855 [Proteobacteria bacterium]|nr:MAG: hypothetical protein DWQ08_12855 [Pseudomonadota bacterium]
MAQARRKTSKPRTTASSHGYGMFAAGLIVGAVGASFVIGLRSEDPESIGRGIAHMIETSKHRFRADDVTAPSAPRPPSESTDFDFYMVLPEIEHIVPDTAQVEETKETEPSNKPAETTPVQSAPDRQGSPAARARFELQAGAFVRESDADRLKARLALEGLESRIQKVTIEGRGDFYRVRLGPFDDSGQLSAVNRKLASIGIKALRLKISGG